MTILVADVGGTNTRLALGEAAGLELRVVQSFRNEDFASLYDVIKAYGAGPIDAVCAAIAGPVSQGQGRLTNRDWAISVDDLKTETGALHTYLMNDLTAVGYAAKHLKPSELHTLVEDTGATNNQSLVVGIGTGFNVCPFQNDSAKTLPSEAEAGHVQLPDSIRSRLADKADLFPTVEDVFSGRGLENVHAALHGQKLDGRSITAGYGQDAHCTQTMEIFAAGLGDILREHALQYMPLNGVYFSGSVVRSVLLSPAKAAFLKAYTQPSRFAHILSSIPMHIILEDAAPLTGCLVAAQQKF